MKRYLYIIIGIVVAAVIVIAILFLIKNRTAGPSLTTSNSTSTGSLPSVGTQGNGGTGTGGTNPVSTLGLTPTASGTASTTPAASGQMTVQSFGVLSSDPVLDYFVDAQNNITAIEPTGEVIAISNGQTTTINSSTISNIISASFSYDGKKIVVNYGDPTDPQSGIFDVATNAWTALPQGMMSPQWSPASNYQIAYLVTTNNEKLALATIDAANLKTAPSVLLALNAEDLTLQWPAETEFVLSDKPTSQSDGSVWLFNSQTGGVNSISYEAAGTESTWSHSAPFPYGLVFSNIGPGSSQLQLESLSGTPAPATFSFLTLPSKCTFNQELMPIATSTVGAASSSASTTSSAASSTSKSKAPAITKAAPTSTPYLALYCGIPRSSSGFSSANLPDAYNTMALFTSDDIYKIDTATGAIQTLWSDQTQNMDISDMKFMNNALFFVNRYDQKLYGLTFSN